MQPNVRTIGYAVVIGVIILAVGLLMTKVARTETADRRLITIAAVVAGAIALGGLATLTMRRRSDRDEQDHSSGQE